MQPTVAIVGRPNVGKSALFNRLAGKDLSIVFDRPGVTRDRLVTRCVWRDKPLTLVDTGGIGLDDSEGFRDAIEGEVDIAVTTATHILFVVDARAGLTLLDKTIAKQLRKTDKPVFVVANKMDSDKQHHDESEFVNLGLGDAHPISAAHGRGIEDLRDAVMADWVEVVPAESEKDRPTRVAMVGRPNVGKSSLINAILEEKRAIVSDVPGTTRDAVDVPFTWKGESFMLIDTAGLRKKARIHDELETRMSGRTAHMINRADVCVLVLETLEGVKEQDKKIAGLIQEAMCPCVVAVNKWDMAQDLGDAGRKKQQEFLETVQQELFFLDYAPIFFISAKNSYGLDRLMQAVKKIGPLRHYHFQTAELNKVLQRAQERLVAPMVHSKRFKIYYGAQKFSEDPRSIPTLLLFVNDPDLLTDAYRRYLELQIRDTFDLVGCPIKIIFRKRPRPMRGRR